jgi:ubiquitin C-terminal hydrolase
MYVQTEKTWIAPRDFVSGLLRTVEACDDDWYRPRYQADAAECMEYILAGIHDAIYRQVRINVHGAPRNDDEVRQTKALESWASFFAKEYSAIVDSFHGQSQCKIQCKTCGSASYRYEPWLMLKLAIPGGHIAGSSVPTLTDCLNAEIADENLEGYDCETCKSKQPAVRSVRISRLPDILLISLKRFTNDGKKIRGTIQWDINNLNLQPWTAFQRCPFSDVSDPSVSCVYETFGVVEHHGSANSGHYISHVRNIGEKEWVTCDDDTIEQNVSTTRIVSPDSYILCMAPKHRVDHLQTQMKSILTKFETTADHDPHA